MCGMMMSGQMPMGMMVMMVLGPVLFLLLLGMTVYYVTRLIIRKNKVEDQPLMILRERYAKGEISEDEYKQRRKFLEE